MESDDRKRIEAETSLSDRSETPPSGASRASDCAARYASVERQDARHRADDPTAGRPPEQIRGSDS